MLKRGDGSAAVGFTGGDLRVPSFGPIHGHRGIRRSERCEVGDMDLRRARIARDALIGPAGHPTPPQGPCAAGMELEERRRLAAVPTLFDTLHDELTEEEGDDAA